MKRGKPTQGVGSPNEPSLDDESGVKAGLSRRHTHRGLGDGQAPKLVTMHGVAPPSDPPPPPSPAQAVRAQNAHELPLSALRSPGLPAFDDDTPDESEFAPVSNQLGMPGDRSQFRTAPGGGKNRVSGGRAAASAYVSPSTLAPGHGAEPKVQSVEVDSRVIREARFHQTEPSLMRRRASHVPPEPTYVPMKKSSWVLPALLALGAAVGIAVVLMLVLQPSNHQSVLPTAQQQPMAGAPRASARPLATHPPAATSEGAVAPVQPAPSEETGAPPPTLSSDATNSRNSALERPTIAHADSSSQALGPKSPTAAERPSTTSGSNAPNASSTAASRPTTAAPKSTAPPKSTAAPKPATAPSRDLWIE